MQLAAGMARLAALRRRARPLRPPAVALPGAPQSKPQQSAPRQAAGAPARQLPAEAWGPLPATFPWVAAPRLARARVQQVTQPCPLVTQWRSTATVTAPYGAVGSAALLLGRIDSASSGRMAQNADAVFARLRAPAQASTLHLVEALAQLASGARGSAPEELEGLAERPPMRQLLSELLNRLPRDTGERVAWEHEWTGQVAGSLRDLRLPDVDTRLLVRLGHTLVQAASTLEFEDVLRAVCDLCAADRRGVAPDDYALWVLGTRLEELCSHSEPGELGLNRLVSLLHLFAHPAIRSRVAGRTSAAVLRHVRHGLPGCGPGQLAKLLQAYSDIPSVVSDALQVLAREPAGSVGRLQGMTLPEVAVVAAALPGAAGAAAVGAEGAAAGPAAAESLVGTQGGLDSVTLAVLLRLREILVQDLTAHAELALMSAANAAGALPAGHAAGSEAMREVLALLGARIFAVDAAVASRGTQERLPAEAIAQLLKLALGSNPTALPGVPASASKEMPSGSGEGQRVPAWLSMAAAELVPRVGELPPARLAELALAVAGATVELDAALPRALQTGAEARAAELSPEEFGDIARSLASASVLEPDLFEAFDVEACLARPVKPAVLPAIAWAMTVAEVEAPVAWALLASRLEACRAKLTELPSSERGLLHEALQARALHSVPWQEGSAAAEICANDSWRTCWHEHQALATPSSAHADTVAVLLQELGFKFDRDLVGKDGLYQMPFLLPAENIVLDLLALKPRHPVSREARGDLRLRHRAWAAAGRSVLAVPDTTWLQLAQKAASAKAASEAVSTEVAQVAEQAEPSKAAGETAAVAAAPAAAAPLTVSPAATEVTTSDALEPAAPVATAPREPAALHAFLGAADQVAAAATAVPGGEAAAGPAAAQEAAPSAVAPEEDRGRASQREWLREKINGIVREDVLKDSGLQEDVAKRLEGVPIGGAGLGLPALKRLAQLSETVRHSSVNKLLETWRKPHIRSLTAWLLGIIKTEEAAAANAAAEKPLVVQQHTGEPRQEQLEAQSKRPPEGWQHKEGRPIEDAKVGEKVSGIVTNVLHGRVWVNAGFVSDITFKSAPGRFKVDDNLVDLEVVSINVANKFVEAAVTRDTRKKSTAPRARPRAVAPKAEATAKAAAAPARRRAASPSGAAEAGSVPRGAAPARPPSGAPTGGGAGDEAAATSRAAQPDGASGEQAPLPGDASKKRRARRGASAGAKRSPSPSKASEEKVQARAKWLNSNLFTEKPIDDAAIAAMVALGIPQAMKLFKEVEDKAGQLKSPSAFLKAAARREGVTQPEAQPKVQSGARKTSLAWKEAATEKPMAGWEHSGGRSLEQLEVGELVQGRVTNVLHERVWVDIGASKDASFWLKKHSFKVGDTVEDIPITSINVKKGHVLLQPPGKGAEAVAQ